MEKIKFITGEWTDENFWKNIYPIIKQSNIPVIRSKRLSVHETYKDFNDRYDIVFMDDRILYFDNDIYLKYLEKIIQLSNKICLFELPFKSLIKNSKTLIKSLSEKTKIAYNFIKNKNDSSCIVSPAITHSCILDYFQENSKYFDAYSIHFYDEHNTKNISYLINILFKIHKFNKKKIYVTKYATPAFDGEIANNNFLNSSWSQCNSFDAASNMNIFFDEINKVSNNISVFYSGTYNDIYNSNRINFIDFDEYDSWHPIHFCGLSDCNGKLKEPIFNAIINR